MLRDIRQAKYDEARETMLSYSSTAMAELLGVTYPTYQKKEAEPGRYLSMDEAVILAGRLGCEPGELYAASE